MSDVLLATASNSIMVGFNVRPERKAPEVAQQEKVDIRLHTVIYELMDEMQARSVRPAGADSPAKWRWAAPKCGRFRVGQGRHRGRHRRCGRPLEQGREVRLLRDNVVIHTGRIDSLRRFKNDVQEVTARAWSAAWRWKTLQT